MITLTVQFLQEERASLSHQITDIETKMSAVMSQEEISTNKKTVDDKMNTLRKTNETRKRSKLERDCEDYANERVYNWTDPNFRRTRPQRKGLHDKSKFTSSSSMASTGSSVNASTTFFEPTQSNPPAGEGEASDTGMATRGAVRKRGNRQRQ